jgi:hypothetical protein
MPFSNAVANNRLGAGEVVTGHVNNVDLFTEFEDGLKIGYFNTIDATGKLIPFDGAKVHGVTTRKLTGDISIEEFTNDNSNEVSSCDMGYVTVVVKDGDTPIKNGLCYAIVADGDDKGKATTDDTGNIQAGVFWMQEKTNVWTIKLRLGGQNV